MKLRELLDIASKGYPDEHTKLAYEGVNDEALESALLDEEIGDTLALFVVREIIGTFDEDDVAGNDADGADVHQIHGAIEAMQRAKDDLEEVINALIAAEEKIVIATSGECDQFVPHEGEGSCPCIRHKGHKPYHECVHGVTWFRMTT